MATYIHGKNAALIHGRYDISPWVTDGTATATLDTSDTSHFGSNAKTYIAGQNDGTMSFSGLHDGTLDAIKDIMSKALLDQTNGLAAVPVILSPEGVKVGGTAIVGLAKQTTYSTNPVVSDVVKVSGDIQITDGYSFGTFLMALNTFATTTNFAAVDNGIGSTFGARVTLHVLDNNNTGTTTFKIQHSVDNATWVDLTSFNAVTTGQETYEYKVLTGGVNRYVRGVATVAGTGTISATMTISRY